MSDQELVRFVAEKVMGWTVIGQGYFRIDAMKLPELHHLIRDWNPLHDGGQALEIVEKLRLWLLYDLFFNRWEVHGSKDIVCTNPHPSKERDDERC